MGWFRVANGYLDYRGPRREAFAAWVATSNGAATVSAASRDIRFSLFGRKRAAERLLWREVRRIGEDAQARSAICEQARVYPALLANHALLDPLPRATVDLRRVVAVPRLLLNAHAHQSMRERLSAVLDTRELRGGSTLLDFLVMTVVDEMDRAFVSARPTARRPLPPRQEWASVGVDLHLKWDVPEWEGPMWPGHHYVYEQPRGGLTRRQRKRLEAAIREMDALIKRWPPSRRHEMLQRAVAGTAA